MPVLARCPLCRAVLPAKAADAEGEVRCPSCAEMVVPATRKLCARCSRDVTRDRRMRDATGEYYCPECWTAVVNEGGARAAFPCGVCGGTFPALELASDGNGVICRTCRAARDLNPETLLSAASELGGEHTTYQPEAETFAHHQARMRRRQQLRVALWVVGGIAAFALIVAIALYAM